MRAVALRLAELVAEVWLHWMPALAWAAAVLAAATGVLLLAQYRLRPDLWRQATVPALDLAGAVLLVFALAPAGLCVCRERVTEGDRRATGGRLSGGWLGGAWRRGLLRWGALRPGGAAAAAWVVAAAACGVWFAAWARLAAVSEAGWRLHVLGEVPLAAVWVLAALGPALLAPLAFLTEAGTLWVLAAAIRVPTGHGSRLVRLSLAAGLGGSVASALVLLAVGGGWPSWPVLGLLAAAGGLGVLLCYWLYVDYYRAAAAGEGPA